MSKTGDKILFQGDNLTEEVNFYEENKEEYLAQYYGKFVLIKGRILVGVYLDFSSAYADGLRILGNVSMLIKQVVFDETTNY